MCIRRFISKDELAKLMGDDESIRDVIAEADKDGVMYSCICFVVHGCISDV